MRDGDMSFKNRIIVHSSLGLALGLLVGDIITAVSATHEYNDGMLYVCTKELTEAVGSELGAFILQTLLSGLFGAVGMGLSSLYRIESWSIAKATGIHFSITLVFFYLTAFTLKWWSIRDAEWCLIMLVIFVAEYLIIWMVNYLTNRKSVREMNKALNEMKLKNSAESEK